MRSVDSQNWAFFRSLTSDSCLSCYIFILVMVDLIISGFSATLACFPVARITVLSQFPALGGLLIRLFCQLFAGEITAQC